MRHIWGHMTYYRPPVPDFFFGGGRVPLSPAGFTPMQEDKFLNVYRPVDRVKVLITISQAVARIADRTAKNCRVT